MVGRPELVLDDDQAIALFGDDVSAKGSDRLLDLEGLEVEFDRLAEQLQVLFIRQPGGEVAGLFRPEVTDGDRVRRPSWGDWK